MTGDEPNLRGADDTLSGRAAPLNAHNNPNADPAPSHRLQAPEILELLKRTGLLHEVRLLRGNNWLPH